MLNNGRVSDSSVKIAKEVEKDLKFYNKQALQYLASGRKDSSCSPLAIWPESVLIQCNAEAEKNGFGDDELNWCYCFDAKKVKLTRRKKGSTGNDLSKDFEEIMWKENGEEYVLEYFTMEIGQCFNF